MCTGVSGHLTCDVRVPRTDAIINGYIIPTGTSGWTSHRHQDIYPSSYVFDSGRQLTESPEELQRPFSNYSPFSNGPRGCIRTHLA
jgi:cytochrome P450